MVSYKEKTEYGIITVKSAVIMQILLEAVEAFRGKAVLSDSKGKPLTLARKIRGVDEEDCIEVRTEEDGLHIRIYIVIRFGASIQRTAAVLIQRIQRGLKMHLGTEAAEVAVVVSGVATTQGITPRKIEFHN